jgi:hypothetical protein
MRELFDRVPAEVGIAAKWRAGLNCMNALCLEASRMASFLWLLRCGSCGHTHRGCRDNNDNVSSDPAHAGTQAVAGERSRNNFGPPMAGVIG